MAAIQFVDTKAAYANVPIHQEGEEKEYQYIKPDHTTTDLPREVKDARLRIWIRDEGLEFLNKALYCLKYTDLKSMNDKEVEAIISSADLVEAEAIRFRRAITSFRNNYSRGRAYTMKKPTTFDDIFKLILVGDCKVGKTNILNRFTKDEFEPSYEETMALNWEDHIVEMAEKNVKLQIYDTSGAHEFGTISKAFFRETHGVLIVYDITNQKSFEHLEKWIEKVNILVDERAWKMLVGNKVDLDDRRVVDKEDGRKLANEYNLKFMECSAKNGSRVDEIFYIAAQYLLAAWDDTTRKEQDEPKKNGCCCVVL